MKILFLHALADPEKGGGAEQTLWTLMRGLRDAGHDCVLLATSDTSGLRMTEREGITVWEAGIRNVYWPYHKKRPAAATRLLWHALDSYNPWMQSFLKQVVAEEQPDVASLHNLPGWSSASWTTLVELNIPIVQVLHDSYSVCVKATMHRNGRNCTNQCADCRIFRLPHRVLSQNVKAVVGVSHFILERHCNLGYFAGVPIQRVIHNARDPIALGVSAISEENSHDGLRFGFIGSLYPAKGIEILIEVFLSSDLPDAELLVAGSGKHHYESYLHLNVTDERIQFMGRVPQREFYSKVDVVVVPSTLNEALGMVVAEALAFGKPVIGARRGGIPEMIQDGENGLLFEPDVQGELAECLQRMHGDSALREKLKANAQPSSTSFMDLDAWVARYEALYAEVIEEGFEKAGRKRYSA
ncbi:glycosyltransferase family 4 protein [Halomonas halodenitrificans]|uniref:glycosyltransferase family 4 protein n=1 Tax=Halomonas halodenitrificans TaxID=28252 RepID=UPI0009FDE0C7|nr:glycosyltransferase family 4 protein [Halomonas halodenitrificans]